MDSVDGIVVGGYRKFSDNTGNCAMVSNSRKWNAYDANILKELGTLAGYTNISGVIGYHTVCLYMKSPTSITAGKTYGVEVPLGLYNEDTGTQTKISYSVMKYQAGRDPAKINFENPSTTYESSFDKSTDFFRYQVTQSALNSAGYTDAKTYTKICNLSKSNYYYVFLPFNNFTVQADTYYYIIIQMWLNGSNATHKVGININYTSDRQAKFGYAYSSSSQYTVTYNANGGSGSMSSSTAIYGMDFKTSQNAFTRTGYTFNGWREGDATTGTYWGITSSNSGTYESGNSWIWTKTSGITLFAQWTRNSYKINYTLNGGTLSAGYDFISKNTNNNWWYIYNPKNTAIPYDTCPSSVTSAASADTTTNNGANGWTAIQNPVKTGYTFTGWTLSNHNTSTAVTYNNGEYALSNYTNGQIKATSFMKLTPTNGATVTFTANWAINTWTVSYNKGNASSGSAPSSQTKTYNTALTLRTNTGSLARSNSTSSAGTHTVTYNANGGTCGTASASSSGTTTTSYTMNGWATGSGGSKVYDLGGSYTNNSAVTLYPSWSSSSSTAWTSVTLPTPTRAGYTFNGWYTAASGGTKVGNAGASYTPSGNITLYAQWTGNQVRLAYHPNGGSISASGYSLNQYGFIQTSSGWAFHILTYPNGSDPYNATTFGLTRTGYTFGGWELGWNRDTILDQNTSYTIDTYLSTQGKKASDNAASSIDCYLYAHWTPNTYTVTYNSNGGSGSMSSSTATYNSGFKTSQNAFTRTGYTFNGWREGDATTGTYWGITSSNSGTYESGNSWIWTKTSGITLYAQWTPNTYNVYFNLNGGTASTIPASTKRTFDAEFTFPAEIPFKPGFLFKGWKYTGRTQDTTTFSDVDSEEKQVTINWKAGASAGTSLTQYAYDANYKAIWQYSRAWTKVGDTWKSVTPYTKVNGEWKIMEYFYYKDGNTWKEGKTSGEGIDLTYNS